MNLLVFHKITYLNVAAKCSLPHIPPAKAAINTQKVALNALVFLYHTFLKQELGELELSLATRPRRLPVVLNPTKVHSVLAH